MIDVHNLGGIVLVGNAVCQLDILVLAVPTGTGDLLAHLCGLDCQTEGKAGGFPVFLFKDRLGRPGQIAVLILDPVAVLDLAGDASGYNLVQLAVFISAANDGDAVSSLMLSS